MILRLAHRLDVPLRERNGLLTAAGFAPMYPARLLTDPRQRKRVASSTSATRARAFPALAVDRSNIVMRNRAVAILLEGVAPALLGGSVNALRLSLHPDGMRVGSSISAHGGAMCSGAQEQFSASGDEQLRSLEAELASYPAPSNPRTRHTSQRTMPASRCHC
jgi:hypothetical protein